MAKLADAGRENVARKRSAAILNMLYEYTTPESGMSIDKIIETLEAEYGIEASERAVRERLKALLEMSDAPKADGRVDRLGLWGEGAHDQPRRRVRLVPQGQGARYGSFLPRYPPLLRIGPDAGRAKGRR